MTRHVFHLRTETIDLLQLLKASGCAMTGGEAQHYVVSGMVSVNGEPESRKRRKLRAGDSVQLADEIEVFIEAASDDASV